MPVPVPRSSEVLPDPSLLPVVSVSSEPVEPESESVFAPSCCSAGLSVPSSTGSVVSCSAGASSVGVDVSSVTEVVSPVLR